MQDAAILVLRARVQAAGGGAAPIAPTDLAGIRSHPGADVDLFDTNMLAFASSLASAAEMSPDDARRLAEALEFARRAPGRAESDQHHPGDGEELTSERQSDGQ
jgi:hypothetical protein